VFRQIGGARLGEDLQRIEERLLGFHHALDAYRAYVETGARRIDRASHVSVP
jgi:hypothetical protein